MSVNKLLLWEKWRPRSIDDVVLLPRIRKQFENGITKNYIFHGHYGTGKTTLARILIGKYDKSKAYLELNSSLYTSIDNLRNEIEEFCKTKPMLESDSDIKYVFLDEFERVSTNYQDAFKAFIEKYHNNVRFILTTNHINKISPGIKSRFSEINFDCQNSEEEKYLKIEIFKRIQNVISKKEEFETSKDHLIQIINKKFPDFRSIMVELQNYIETGNINSNTSNISTKTKLDLYNILYDSSLNYDSIYSFLMSNFGPDKIDTMISLLSKQFIDWSIIEKKEDVNKLFQTNFIISDYSPLLETNTDPVILGMTIIGKFREILL